MRCISGEPKPAWSQQSSPVQAVEQYGRTPQALGKLAGRHARLVGEGQVLRTGEKCFGQMHGNHARAVFGFDDELGANGGHERPAAERHRAGHHTEKSQDGSPRTFIDQGRQLRIGPWIVQIHRSKICGVGFLGHSAGAFARTKHASMQVGDLRNVLLGECPDVSHRHLGQAGQAA